jgi:phage head maturation protease
MHDKWTRDEKDVVYRDVTDLVLYEVGPVTNPAYIQTTASVRSKELVREKMPPTIPLELRKKQQIQSEK